MINIHGTPHLFFTLSAADLQWPDLHRHMPSEIEVPPGNESAAKRQRRLALQRNPHLAASYLDERLQLSRSMYSTHCLVLSTFGTATNGRTTGVATFTDFSGLRKHLMSTRLTGTS